MIRCDQLFVTCDPIGSSLKGPAPPEVDPGVEEPLSWLLVVESRPPTPDSDFRCPDWGEHGMVELGFIPICTFLSWLRRFVNLGNCVK